MVYIATLTSKGQITLPKGLRKILGLEKKDKVIFAVIEKDTALLRPLGRDFLSFGKSVRPKDKEDFHKIRKSTLKKLAKAVANE